MLKESLPFGSLPAHSARRFLPADADLNDVSLITALFERLKTAAPARASAGELERWLLDWSELDGALDEEASKRYIAMTCHTDDPDAERAYLHYIEEVEPILKPAQIELGRIFLAHPLLSRLPQDRYFVFIRELQVQVELFRQENVPLETEESKVCQRYQKLSGSLTVEFQGKEQTLVQMGKYLEEPDRALRQEAWDKVARRRLQEAPAFEEIFQQLLSLRERIAANAGFANYRDYAFRWRGRFDYTPEQCLQFHEAIERVVMPCCVKLQEKRKNRLKIDTLRPWDLTVDPQSRPALRPFAKTEELLDRTQNLFERVDPVLAGQFHLLQRQGLLDLANRKGKAPGGYQTTLSEARLPFIFMNAVGRHRDVETLLHEAGHAFHTLACRPEDFYPYRGAPLEFAEVASMAMELLGSDEWSVFYTAPDAARARRQHLEGILDFFPWMATVDAFQHWVYTHPGQTNSDRHQAWEALMKRFGGIVDWSGYEPVRAHLWHRQPHIFLNPFYYVEYGIAQLGALQIWTRAMADRAQALRDYRRALALGGSRPLPELFAAAGCRFAFDTATLQPLIEAVEKEIEHWEAAETRSLEKNVR